MRTAFDPLHRLTTQESIRFVGTIGGVSTNVPDHLSEALALYMGREVRTASELVERVKASAGCTAKVAAVSVEEASALGLIASIPSPTQRHKKYVLGDQGRVVNAMRTHRDWRNPNRRNLLFLRPMFEANGDYLLQAMSALEKYSDSRATDTFRSLVQAMASAKVAELPTNHTGSKWDAYRQAVIARKRSIFGEDGGIDDGNLSLASLQKQRRQASEQLLGSLRRKRVTSTDVVVSKLGVETRTMDHHFARCRAWLEALGLVDQRPSRLSASGETLLNYFKDRLGGSILSIPPSLATLSDCFRIDEDEAQDIWGAVIDEDFWEDAILTLEAAGFYTPSDVELKQRFDSAFESVRVTGITEAMLSPLRQALFFGFLWDGKPVKTLSSAISGESSIPDQYPNEYGFGRNRQGRLAYLFRKTPTLM